ncbi:MAG TPA: ABC transporter permease, partial [Trebonia sp.]
VWVAEGQAERIAAALERENLAVSAIRHATELERRFTTQGPGSALTLLLAAAVAAAALALGRAVLALYTAARARGYELAALDAAGVKPGALRLALFLEQVFILGTGTLAGLLAGVSAARLALPRIPQFADQPVTPPLAYPLDPVPVFTVGAAALLGSLLLAAALSELLLRGVTVDRLREAPG